MKGVPKTGAYFLMAGRETPCRSADSTIQFYRERAVSQGVFESRKNKYVTSPKHEKGPQGARQHKVTDQIHLFPAPTSRERARRPMTTAASKERKRPEPVDDDPLSTCVRANPRQHESIQPLLTRWNDDLVPSPQMRSDRRRRC